MFLIILVLARWIKFTSVYTLVFTSKFTARKALGHPVFLVSGKQFTAFTSLQSSGRH